MCRSNGRRLMVRPVVITQTTLLRSLALLLLNYHTERLSVKKSKGLGAREDEGFERRATDTAANSRNR